MISAVGEGLLFRALTRCDRGNFGDGATAGQITASQAIAARAIANIRR